MNSMLERFLKNIGQRGLTIRHDGGDKFSLVGPQEEKTPEVIKACKAFKPLLIEKYCPKDAPAEANNPANTIELSAGERLAPVSMPVISGPKESTDPEWQKCSLCRSDVSPPQMKAMTQGIWFHTCGQPKCPYKPRGA